MYAMRVCLRGNTTHIHDGFYFTIREEKERGKIQ